MAIGGINGAQSQPFVELANKPQMAYANPPILSMNGQPEMDSYEGPQEEKKGSFLGKVVKTILFAGAVIGLNRYAHSKEWIKPVEENATGFVNKYIKKPLNSLDEYVVKKYDKIFNKEAAKEAPEAASTEAAK